MAAASFKKLLALRGTQAGRAFEKLSDRLALARLQQVIHETPVEAVRIRLESARGRGVDGREHVPNSLLPVAFAKRMHGKRDSRVVHHPAIVGIVRKLRRQREGLLRVCFGASERRVGGRPVRASSETRHACGP